MKDARVDKLAKVLVGYSVSVQTGEKVLIEAFDVPDYVVTAMVREVCNAGGYPFVQLRNNSIERAVRQNMSKEFAQLMADYDGYRMQDMDCYIGIRGSLNSYELADISEANNNIYSTIYSHPVHHNIRVKKTKWVVLRWANESMSQLAKMPTDVFENYFFNVCTMDYMGMDKAMDSLVSLMNRTDKVRLVSPNTDVSFSIKDIPAVKCSGRRNIPDGEVYTAPVKDSVNGYITYNAPSFYQGDKFEDIKLMISCGKIIECYGNKPDKIDSILSTDDGSRYFGEFAIGVNPYITQPMGDILFDEKIAGSIHFTPGASYEEASNGNDSAVHWDLVLMMDKGHGGGQIYFDDVLIRNDGVFVLDELKCLNAENLKTEI